MVRYSVIVPVFKVEQFLERCVGSILSQSFQDFELILVDDGSPDRSGAICDSYARKDSRVRVIHQENGGVSVARNRGIKAAEGEYFAFVDADDLVSPDFLWHAERVLQEEPEADLIQFGWKSFVEGESLESVENTDCRIRTHSRKDAMGDFLNFRIFTHSPWGKVMHRSLLTEENLFPAGIRVGEDLHVSYRWLGQAQHIVSTEAVAYYYCIREDSAMTGRKLASVLDAFRVFGWMYEYYQRNYPELKAAAALRYANDMMQLLWDLQPMEKSDEKKSITAQIRKALATTPDDILPAKVVALKKLALYCPVVYFLIYKFRRP